VLDEVGVEGGLVLRPVRVPAGGLGPRRLAGRQLRRLARLAQDFRGR